MDDLHYMKKHNIPVNQVRVVGRVGDTGGCGVVVFGGWVAGQGGWGVKRVGGCGVRRVAGCDGCGCDVVRFGGGGDRMGTACFGLVA